MRLPKEAFRDFNPGRDRSAGTRRLSLPLQPHLDFDLAWQPFLQYEVKGISRRAAHFWHGLHYPIGDDMVGRELYDGEPEFWNPDLPYGANHDELKSAGERLLHGIMGLAHSLGMECVLTTSLMNFPPEFAPLLKNPQKVRQLGEMTVAPGPDTEADDPALAELASAALMATVNTGLLPQLTAGSLSWIVECLVVHGWAGFSTRYWLVGDHDPCPAFLSASAWRQTAHEDVYRDQISTVRGTIPEHGFPFGSPRVRGLRRGRKGQIE